MSNSKETMPLAPQMQCRSLNNPTPVLNAVGEGICVLNLQGNITFANQAMANMVGWPGRALLGQCWHPLLHYAKPDGQRRAWEESPIWRTLQDGVCRQVGDDVLWCKDGTGLPVDYTSTPLEEGGQIVGVVAVFRDVAERHQMALRLREREEEYLTLSRIVEQNPTSILITDPAGKIKYVNPRFTQVTGYTPKDSVGQTPRILKSGLTPPEEYKRLWATITSGGEWRGELHNRKKNGDLFWALSLISPITNQAGDITHFLAIFKDITGRKRLEETWRRYEFIVNTSKEFMTLINSRHVYEAANESYCQAHNKQRQEIVGKTVGDVWGEETYLTYIKGVLEQCFAGEEAHFQGWLNYAALGRRYVGVTYYPYYNAAGIVTHSVVVSRDITEQKRAEEALQKAHARNEQLLESISLILIGVGSDDEVTHWNGPAEAAFDIPAADVLGRQFLDCGIDWDWMEILVRIGNCRQEIRPTRVNDIKYTRPDGKEGFLNITVTPFAGEVTGHAGYLLLGEDVTERKVLQVQLAHAQKLESIGQLAAGIAHEINTPTQYVGDNARFLQESFADIAGFLEKFDRFLEAAKEGALPSATVAGMEKALDEADIAFLLEEIPTAIEQSLEGIDHVSDIVRAMKEFSHPGVEEKTAIDINRAIESTITIACNEWKYVADMITDFDRQLPPVPCLPGELTQVVLNMIINATHAIASVVEDAPQGKGTITVSTRRDGDWAEIRVGDTGTGIPESARSKVFDPFFTTKEVGQGTGQGLSISHAVVTEKHGGTITFETELGQGTTFIIRLPLDSAGGEGKANGEHDE